MPVNVASGSSGTVVRIRISQASWTNVTPATNVLLFLPVIILSNSYEGLGHELTIFIHKALIILNLQRLFKQAKCGPGGGGGLTKEGGRG